jgi:hypothetical protein
MSDVPWTRNREHGPGGSVINTARLECKVCGTHEDISLRKHLPPEVLAKKFGSMGWDVNRTNGTCPGCKMKAKEKPPVEEKTVAVIQAIKPQPPKALTEPTMRQMRDIFEALEMYWASDKGQYTGGYSDEKIGQEMGLPSGVIAKVRKEAFGDFKFDPEIEALMEESKTLNEKADAQMRSARFLTTQVETLLQSARDLRSAVDMIDLRIKKIGGGGE